MRRLLAALYLALAASGAEAWTHGVAAPPTVGTLAIGAGGFISGLDVNPTDGTTIGRTDTYGAYLYANGLWNQLVTATSMGTFVNPANYGSINSGVYEIVSAPSNSSHLYMEYLGYVFTSLNKGSTWTQTGFTQVGDGSNDGARGYGKKIAVDPINENVAYVGSESGLFVTTNGGTSWSAVASGIAASTTDSVIGVNPGYLVAFDSSGGTSGGRTNNIDVFSSGNGLYKSTNQGSSFTLTTSGPTRASHFVVDASGVVYMAQTTGQSLYKYASGAWTSVSTGTESYPIWAVALDPLTSGHVTVATVDGELSSSANGGTSWTGYSAPTFVATDIPWLAYRQTGQPYMTIGNIAYSSTVSGQLTASAGLGVWMTTPPSTQVSNAYTSQSLGIEQLVANVVTSSPGINPITGTWDDAVFRSITPTTYPSVYYPGNGFNLVAGWDVDCSAFTTGACATVADFSGVEESGYTLDGGLTWTAFASYAPWANSRYGGAVAVATPTNFIAVPTDEGSNANSPWYTTNAGGSWTAMNFTSFGVPASGTTGWDSNYYFNRHTIAADKVNSGTFWIENDGTGTGNTGGGVYKITGGGTTIAKTYSGQPCGMNMAINSTMKAAPSNAGHLWATGGNVGGTQPTGESFCRSIDGGGATWGAVTGVEDVQYFGFGHAAPSGSYPALYIYGWVNCGLVTCQNSPGSGYQFGFWESDNASATTPSWTFLVEWAGGSIDLVKTVSGDMDSYGVAYIGYIGSGFKRVQTSIAQVAPNVNNIAANAPTTTTANITWSTDQASTTVVNYGTTTGYGSTYSNASLVTSHTVALSGLTAGTAYHFDVQSANASGFAKAPSPDHQVYTPSVTNQTSLDSAVLLTGTGTPGNQTLLTGTLPTITAGDVLICGVTEYNGSPVVSDAAGLTWSIRSGSPFSGGGQAIAEFYAISAGAHTNDAISITGQFMNVGVCKSISGVNTAALFDGSVTVSASATQGSLTTSNIHTFAWGTLNCQLATPAAGTGFTASVSAGANYTLDEYLNPPPSSAQSGLAVTQTGCGTAPVIITDALVSQ